MAAKGRNLMVEGRPRLVAVEGDITRLDVEVLVTAANSRLAGGGGVDGAVHRAAGPELLAACRDIGGCPTGEARITPGFNLEARYVVHAVGPVWRGGHAGEAELLAGCYRHALDLARARDAASIAFPAISTGIYGYPLGAAAAVAVGTVAAYLEAHETKMERVVFSCFGREVHAVYADALAALPVRAGPSI